MINVEVVYADECEQALLKAQLPDNSIVMDAIYASGILDRFPEINLNNQKIGIFGDSVEKTDPLSDGDRVEIYRPLKVDPKEARRQRVKELRGR